MTETEHLLTIFAEECAEAAQRATKVLRFGIGEIQPGQSLTNSQRLEYELNDLYAMAQMLADLGLIDARPNPLLIAEKRKKVFHFLEYAREQGTVNE